MENSSQYNEPLCGTVVIPILYENFESAFKDFFNGIADFLWLRWCYKNDSKGVFFLELSTFKRPIITFNSGNERNKRISHF